MNREYSSHSFELGLAYCSTPLRLSLEVIRRKLWILNTKLQSLPAKIELIYRQSGEWGNVDDIELCTHDRIGLAKEPLNAGSGLRCWLAKWNSARLRARADRAERHAIVAMNKASESLSKAFEAVLKAACARMRVEQACRNITETPTPQCSDKADEWNFNPRKTPSVRNFE